MHPDGAPLIVVPTYDPENGCITAWDPAEPRNGLMLDKTVPDGLLPYLQALPRTGGLVAIPLAPETEALFAALQRVHPRIQVAVSAEQYAAITGEPCSAAWVNEDTGQSGSIVLHEGSPSPAPSC